MSISHLQFADDTLILGEKGCANVRDMQVFPYLFVAMSGLQINFHKSLLVGVNVPDFWLQEVAYVLRCKVVDYLSCIWVSPLGDILVS